MKYNSINISYYNQLYAYYSACIYFKNSKII